MWLPILYNERATQKGQVEVDKSRLFLVRRPISRDFASRTGTKSAKVKVYSCAESTERGFNSREVDEGFFLPAVILRERSELVIPSTSRLPGTRQPAETLTSLGTQDQN